MASFINRGLANIAENFRFITRKNFAGQRLRDYNFREQNLTRANFTGADLTGANFTGAVLAGANFTDAILPRAKFNRAILTDAILTNANLIRAEFINSAGLTGANLNGANLTDAILIDANLNRAKFINADLTRANLLRAHLTDANLTDANLTRAFLNFADLTGANLTRANLTNAILIDANLTDANFTDAILTDVELDEAIITDTTILNHVPARRAPAHQVDAYQIHIESGKINYGKLNEFLKSKIDDSNIPSDINYAQFVEDSISTIINESSNSEEIKTNLRNGLEQIMSQRLRLLDYKSFPPKMLQSIFYALQYVKKQSSEFKDMYVETFISDCVNAYNGQHGMTCAAGALERIIMSLVPACTADSTPENQELLAIITANPNVLIPQYIQDWYKLHKKGTEGEFPTGTTEEYKKNDLKQFLLGYFPNEENLITEKISEIADNIGYDDDDFLYGGRKKRNAIKIKKQTKNRKINNQMTKNRKTNKMRKTNKRKYTKRRTLKIYK
jgi:uncharacterized protein YjbI with pentapeptide repeats